MAHKAKFLAKNHKNLRLIFRICLAENGARSGNAKTLPKINYWLTFCSDSPVCSLFTTSPSKVLINQTHFLTGIGVNNTLRVNLAAIFLQIKFKRPQGSAELEL
jgi:hypothetical protein